MPPDATAPTQLGSYDIVSRIAEGGMGTVYKARHRTTGAVVAVKVIAAATAKNPVLLQRFEREFQAARVLDHPNVVRAIEYCGSGPQPFLVMEYVDGESVGQRVERAGAFPEAEAVRLIAQVCEGLQRAHKQGLVHRDVKPDNILITRDGVAKLTDLGLVRDVDGDLNLTKTGRGLGTPHYMAPEQFRNAKNVDVRGDVYSLGATLYAMVTGQVPFENASPLDCWMKKIRNEFPPPKELAPRLSDRVDWAIRRAMSAEPDRRPASCREFLEDLTGQGRAAPPKDPAAAGGSDIWYLVYKDETGATCTVKGTTGGIRNALRDRLLGDAGGVLVSRAKAGPFVSLAAAPEFRDLVVDPAPLAGPGSGPVRRAGGPTPLPGPAAGRDRRADQDETVEYGADPPPAGASGSRSAPPSGRASGARAAVPGRTTTPLPTPLPVADPHAETDPYVPAEEADRPTRPLRRKPARARKKPFDWTPVLLVVVAVLSAAIGYLVLAK
ncbi:MAG: serine/threonine protein kinase [Isosphaera sp.]|nr:serine/threonine protein kinase [Isosphaera sp.]